MISLPAAVDRPVSAFAQNTAVSSTVETIIAAAFLKDLLII
jgi:hypothetical protein